jgi:hypothetical protein
MVFRHFGLKHVKELLPEFKNKYKFYSNINLIACELGFQHSEVCEEDARATTSCLSHTFSNSKKLA